MVLTGMGIRSFPIAHIAKAFYVRSVNRLKDCIALLY
jgi:hypothetical protein